MTANLMSDGIYYEPDIRPVTMQAYGEDEEFPDNEIIEEEWDYYDPADVESDIPLIHSGSAWGMGSAGFYDPFYAPMMGGSGWNYGLGYSTMGGWGFNVGYGMGGGPFGWNDPWGMNPWMSPWGMNPWMSPWGMNPWMTPWGFGGGFGDGNRNARRINTMRPSRQISRNGGDGFTPTGAGKVDVYEGSRNVRYGNRASGRTAQAAGRTVTPSRTAQQGRASRAGTAGLTVDRDHIRQRIRQDMRKPSGGERSSRPVNRPAVNRNMYERAEQNYHGRPAIPSRTAPSRTPDRSFVDRVLDRLSPSRSGSDGSRSRSFDHDRPQRSRSESPSRTRSPSTPSRGSGRSPSRSPSRRGR